MQEEAGRYAVFVGNACPWCHRVLLALILRGLLPAVQIVPMADDPERASRGSPFIHLTRQSAALQIHIDHDTPYRFMTCRRLGV
jgi:glutathionyl-hydroquinone reductase